MRKALLFGAAIVVVLAVAILVLGLQPLRSQRLESLVEDRLSEMLGEPVAIGRIGVTIYPQFGASATDVRIGTAGVPAPSLDVGRIVIRPRFGPLLRGDIRIRDVELEGFVVSLLRDPEGRWHLPPLVPVPTTQQKAGAAIEEVHVTQGRVRVFDGRPGGPMEEAGSIDDLAARMEQEPEGLRLSPITGRIGSAAISGEARAARDVIRLELTTEGLTDDDLPSLLRLLGADRPDFLRLGEAASLTGALNIDRQTSRLAGTGRVRAPAVQFDSVHIEGFEAPFTIDGDALTFSPATFTLYGGSHSGTITLDPLSRGVPRIRWRIDSRVTGVDASGFLGAVTGRDQQLDGTADLTASLNGRVDAPLAETASGRVQLLVRDGVIRDFPLLASIDRAAGLAEQQDGHTAFARLSATWDIAEGTARTENLLIQAQHVQLRAAGRVGVNRTVDLRGTAVLSPERSAQAIASVHELSGLRNKQGEIELPLTITGTLEAPSFNIDLESILAKGLKDELRRRLNRIIKR